MNYRNFILALVVISLGGCSGKVKDFSVKPESKEIGGDLSGFVELGDQNCQIIKSTKYGKAFETKVKLKVVKPMNPKEINIKINQLALNLLDESGSPVTGFDKFVFDGLTSYDDVAKLNSMLEKGNGEIFASFYMEQPYKFDEAVASQNQDKAQKFSIESSLFTKEESTTSSETSSSETSSNESSFSDEDNPDWDEVITEYKSTMQSYIELLQKATDDDATALAEYPEIYSKALSLAEKIQKAGNKVSPKQMTKFMKVQTDFMEKAMEIQKK